MTAPDESYAAILGATSQIEWKALERHFAAGSLLSVSRELDLVEVAGAFTRDDTEQVRHWMEAKQLGPASDEEAADWSVRNPDTLWAVVIRPWVLVQERAATH
ncbi:DUF2288 domain-containing protein [uncultured Halopseudomonas sp.]|uniref:DUF2288 domain-containing protein n=1 Tax=uncultured Halopseudomonas sp. TaxID=2901193 RepID=UPI0030EF7D7C|tara:strand:+ start:1393 stop:1701 length:309 start_codon:yes stop_codon:yes gene_type:complete